MSEQEEPPLVVALTVVLQGCKNQYEQVLKRTGTHPAYREAIPVVERHLAELQDGHTLVRAADLRYCLQHLRTNVAYPEAIDRLENALGGESS